MLYLHNKMRTANTLFHLGTKMNKEYNMNTTNTCIFLLKPYFALQFVSPQSLYKLKRCLKKNIF